MSKEQIKELAEACGWIEILPQKNPYMISFKTEEEPDARINVYFTRMTVTVQWKSQWGRMEKFYEVGANKLEDIFLEFK